MKIQIKKYNPIWKKQFFELHEKLSNTLQFLSPRIEHIGSTSVPDLSAKPIIDVAVGIESLSDLDLVVEPMVKAGFIYYEAFNKDMPNRRLFVGLIRDADVKHFQSVYKDGDIIPHAKINALRQCHIHVWEFGSLDWERHIAFREYLKNHSGIKEAYEKLKWRLGYDEWEHGMAYNDGKNDFVTAVQALALDWYKMQNK